MRNMRVEEFGAVCPNTESPSITAHIDPMSEKLRRWKASKAAGKDRKSKDTMKDNQQKPDKLKGVEQSIKRTNATSSSPTRRSRNFGTQHTRPFCFSPSTNSTVEKPQITDAESHKDPNHNDIEFSRNSEAETLEPHIVGSNNGIGDVFLTSKRLNTEASPIATKVNPMSEKLRHWKASKDIEKEQKDVDMRDDIEQKPGKLKGMEQSEERTTNSTSSSPTHRSRNFGTQRSRTSCSSPSTNSTVEKPQITDAESHKVPNHNDIECSRNSEAETLKPHIVIRNIGLGDDFLTSKLPDIEASPIATQIGAMSDKIPLWKASEDVEKKRTSEDMKDDIQQRLDKLKGMEQSVKHNNTTSNSPTCKRMHFDTQRTWSSCSSPSTNGPVDMPHVIDADPPNSPSHNNIEQSRHSGAEILKPHVVGSDFNFHAFTGLSKYQEDEQLQENDDNCCVKVVVRIRPAPDNDDVGKYNCLHVVAKNPNAQESPHPEIKYNMIEVGGCNINHNFTFDHVFPPSTDQRQLYDTCISPMVSSVLEGYNATFLTYGQTGSGKTYTMIGYSGDEDRLKHTENGNIPEDVTGIIPKALKELFKGLNDKLESQVPEQQKSTTKASLAAYQSPFFEYQVKVQFLELYEDDVLDLISIDADDYNEQENHSPEPNSRSTSPSRTSRNLNEVNLNSLHQNAFAQVNRPHKNIPRLTIRDGKEGEDAEVVGISQCEVQSAEEALKYLYQGIKLRRTESTAMNANSSRSHAIFTVLIQQSQKKIASGQNTDGHSMEVKTSKIHFVDLAGSERIKTAKTDGKRMQEGISINKGLFVLGNVVSALANNTMKQEKMHIPYRDSKLTRLLKGSLGGNHKTLMIACVSSGNSNKDESITTLRYASRAKKIKNDAKVNVDPISRKINELKGQVAALATELLRFLCPDSFDDNVCPFSVDYLKDLIRTSVSENKWKDINMLWKDTPFILPTFHPTMSRSIATKCVLSESDLPTSGKNPEKTEGHQWKKYNSHDIICNTFSTPTKDQSKRDMDHDVSLTSCRELEKIEEISSIENPVRDLPIINEDGPKKIEESPITNIDEPHDVLINESFESLCASFNEALNEANEIFIAEHNTTTMTDESMGIIHNFDQYEPGSEYGLVNANSNTSLHGYENDIQTMIEYEEKYQAVKLENETKLTKVKIENFQNEMKCMESVVPKLEESSAHSMAISMSLMETEEELEKLQSDYDNLLKLSSNKLCVTRGDELEGMIDNSPPLEHSISEANVESQQLLDKLNISQLSDEHFASTNEAMSTEATIIDSSMEIKISPHNRPNEFLEGSILDVKKEQVKVSEKLQLDKGDISLSQLPTNEQEATFIDGVEETIEALNMDISPRYHSNESVEESIPDINRVIVEITQPIQLNESKIKNISGDESCATTIDNVDMETNTIDSNTDISPTNGSNECIKPRISYLNGMRVEVTESLMVNDDGLQLDEGNILEVSINEPYVAIIEEDKEEGEPTIVDSKNMAMSPPQYYSDEVMEGIISNMDQVNVEVTESLEVEVELCADVDNLEGENMIEYANMDTSSRHSSNQFKDGSESDMNGVKVEVTEPLQLDEGNRLEVSVNEPCAATTIIEGDKEEEVTNIVDSKNMEICSYNCSNENMDDSISNMNPVNVEVTESLQVEVKLSTDEQCATNIDKREGQSKIVDANMNTSSQHASNQPMGGSKSDMNTSVEVTNPRQLDEGSMFKLSINEPCTATIEGDKEEEETTVTDSKKMDISSYNCSNESIDESISNIDQTDVESTESLQIKIELSADNTCATSANKVEDEIMTVDSNTDTSSQHSSNQSTDSSKSDMNEVKVEVTEPLQLDEGNMLILSINEPCPAPIERDKETTIVDSKNMEICSYNCSNETTEGIISNMDGVDIEIEEPLQRDVKLSADEQCATSTDEVEGRSMIVHEKLGTSSNQSMDGNKSDINIVSVELTEPLQLDEENMLILSTKEPCAKKENLDEGTTIVELKNMGKNPPQLCSNENMDDSISNMSRVNVEVEDSLQLEDVKDKKKLCADESCSTIIEKVVLQLGDVKDQIKLSVDEPCATIIDRVVLQLEYLKDQMKPSGNESCSTIIDGVEGESLNVKMLSSLQSQSTMQQRMKKSEKIAGKIALFNRVCMGQSKKQVSRDWSTSSTAPTVVSSVDGHSNDSNLTGAYRVSHDHNMPTSLSTSMRSQSSIPPNMTKNEKIARMNRICTGQRKRQTQLHELLTASAAPTRVESECNSSSRFEMICPPSEWGPILVEGNNFLTATENKDDSFMSLSSKKVLQHLIIPKKKLITSPTPESAIVPKKEEDHYMTPFLRIILQKLIIPKKNTPTSPTILEPEPVLVENTNLMTPKEYENNCFMIPIFHRFLKLQKLSRSKKSTTTTLSSESEPILVQEDGDWTTTLFTRGQLNTPKKSNNTLFLLPESEPNLVENDVENEISTSILPLQEHDENHQCITPLISENDNTSTSSTPQSEPIIIENSSNKAESKNENDICMFSILAKILRQLSIRKENITALSI